MTVSAVVLAALWSGALTRLVIPKANLASPSSWVIAAAGIGVLIAALAAIGYWGFRPLLREGRLVEKVIAKSAGIKSWALEPAVEARQRKRGRDASTLRFRLLVGIAVALSVAVILLRHFVPTQPSWYGGALFCGGLAVHEFMLTRKPWNDRLAYASFWTLLFAMGWGDEVVPHQSLWAGLTFFSATCAVGFAMLQQKEHKEESHESVLEAFRSAEYDLALERASKIDPEHSERSAEYRVRAPVHYRKQELDSAEVLVRKALSIQRESRRASQLLTLLSSVLIEKGEFDNAQKAAEGAAELDTLNGEADRMRTLVLLRQGRDPHLALQLSQKALVCEEEEKALALAVHAWALAANGKDNEARAAIDHALSLPGKQTRPELSELSFYAGKALQVTGDHAASARCFATAREAEPRGLFGLLAAQQMRREEVLAS